jgi:glycosyltransferase involved in cell wall biosynthesis
MADGWSGLRVALVHDWLTGMRGGEKVLEALCRIFPGADLLTLVHARGQVSALIESRRIRTSAVNRFPHPARFYRHYLPTFPTVIECFDLDDVDLVISTSHCAAKSVVRTGRAVHVCYCHSPMRYAWDQYEAYFGSDRLGPAARTFVRPVMAWLARWDRDTAHRVDRYLANSSHVAGRIARYYGRSADVLHPPVDIDFYTPSSDAASPDRAPADRAPFLVVSALVPYKRIEIAIQAAERIGAPLRVVGSGPDEARLRRLAGPTVEFLGTIDDVRLRDEYRRARALVLPGEEDFGIAPVESLACGRPVVALRRGGATESVADGVTGRLVDNPTVEAFAEAMDGLRADAFDSARLRSAAEAFGPDKFDASFRAFLTDTLVSNA